MKPAAVLDSGRYFQPRENPRRTGSWISAEKRQRLDRPLLVLVSEGQRRHTQSLRRADREEFTDDVFQRRRVGEFADDPWDSWKVRSAEVGLFRCQAQRRRSLIRTNPWIGSTGDSPPWSPSYACRSGPGFGAQMDPNSTFLSPRTPRAGIDEYRLKTSPPLVYSRQDSLLTTSIESESLCPSGLSDTETTTSQQSDAGSAHLHGDERYYDVISYDVGVDVTSTSFRNGRLRKSTKADEFTDREFRSANPTRFSSSRLHRQDASTWNDQWSLNTNHPSIDQAVSRSSSTCQAKSPSAKAMSDSLNFRRTSERTQFNAISQGSSSEDLAHQAPSYSTSSLQFRRKILEVRTSLQDKVSTLRREKKMVDEKIEEAKEEERLRLRQMEKFRQQLSETRKEILLRTLEDIKRNLKEQSVKLQKLYDIVLVEQSQLLRSQ